MVFIPINKDHNLLGRFFHADFHEQRDSSDILNALNVLSISAGFAGPILFIFNHLMVKKKKDQILFKGLEHITSNTNAFGTIAVMLEQCHFCASCS